jgi:hypothetical protein
MMTGVFGQYRGFAMVDPARFGVAVTTDTVLHTMQEGRLCLLLVRRGSPPFEGEALDKRGFRSWVGALDLREETGVRTVAPRPAKLYRPVRRPTTFPSHFQR